MNKKIIEEILSNISMAPSCLDMGWEWKVKQLGVHGFVFSLSFQRPDTNTGLVDRGWGRDWYVPEDATEKFVVMTSLLAIELIVRHEYMEAFHYKNARLVDPHKSLSELAHPQTLGQIQKIELKETKVIS